MNLNDKGLTSEEFVDTLEISDEEKNLKFELITTILNVRASYRAKLDELRKR